MFCRFIGITALCLLIFTAGIADAGKKKSKKKGNSGGGGGWFSSGGSNHEEAEQENEGNEEQTHQNRIREQLLQRLNLEKSRNTAVLLVQLNKPQTPETLQLLSDNWSTILASVHIQIETFALSEDRIIVKVNNAALAHDVKNFLLDEQEVSTITVEERRFSGVSTLEQELEQENGEEQEQQEQEEQRGKNREKEYKKSKKSKKSKKNEL